MRTILLTAFLLLISADYTIAQKAGQPEPGKKSDAKIKLYAFDGGRIQVNELSMFSGGERYKGQQKKLADPFFVIQHPSGNLLWDTGLPEQAVASGAQKLYGGDIVFTRQDSTADQLKTIGFSPKDIDYIAFSHHHIDHVGGAASFKNATLLVQKVEFKAMMEDTSAAAPHPFRIFSKVNELQGDYDVFGDGKVIIKSYPGHTIGHQALYVELKNKGPVLLTGDLYHFTENRQNKVVPSLNYNAEQTRRSMEQFETFAREKGAKVIIQHEMEDFKHLPVPPQYWD